MISKFMNKHFIYSAKSVKKEGIIDILKLCNALNDISLEILSLLYNNLSSFVIFTQINKKFYLPKGPKSQLK